MNSDAPTNCPVCGAVVNQTGGPGRPRVYDSDACRKRAHSVRLLTAELERLAR